MCEAEKFGLISGVGHERLLRLIRGEHEGL